MESSPDEFRGSSPPALPQMPTPSRDPEYSGDLEMGDSDLESTPSQARIKPANAASAKSTFDLSSDPITSADFHPNFRPHSGQAAATLLCHTKRPISKRQLQLPTNFHPAKEPRLSSSTSCKSARDAILQARDLLVEAYSLTDSRDEQSKLLDLLEVFREFTEKGALSKASSIITSQIAHLETATRSIENKTRALAQVSVSATNTSKSTEPKLLPATKIPSAQNPTYASIASENAHAPSQPTEWSLVGPKKPTKSPKSATKVTNSRRLILVQSPTGSSSNSFSPLALRNAFNKAFSDKGITGPVVTSVTRSLGGNLVVTTTSAFTADFLLEKRPIWGSLIPFKSAQKDEAWHKVVLHGIPTADFNTPDGMALIKDEITTFNHGFTPIGTPYWLSSAENRANKRAGSVAVAFATEEEATRAIRHRLYVAGISVRVERLYTAAPTAQCYKCQGFGHLEQYCKNSPKCRFCSEHHATKLHACNNCNTKGAKCCHLAPKCANCSQAHTADSKACEVLLAIKSKSVIH